jgi:hypothetical protein
MTLVGGGAASAAARWFGRFVRRAEKAEDARSVAAFGAGGEFSPDEVDGEGEDGEDEQKVNFPVRDVAEENFDEPEDGQHRGEQEEEHCFVVLGLWSGVGGPGFVVRPRRKANAEGRNKDAGGEALVVQKPHAHKTSMGHPPTRNCKGVEAKGCRPEDRRYKLWRIFWRSTRLCVATDFRIALSVPTRRFLWAGTAIL